MIFEQCTFTDENKVCNCILHCKKDEKFNSIEDFWNEIHKIIELLQICSKRLENNVVLENFDNCYNFEKIWFPKFQNENIGTTFHNLDKYKYTNFYTFNKPYKQLSTSDSINLETQEEVRNNYPNTIFDKLEISFKECHFIDISDFRKYKLEKPIMFTHCHFHKELLLSDRYINNITFINCNFYNNELDISNRTFNNTFILKSTINDKNSIKLKAENTNFNGTVDFINSNFETINLKGATFEKLILFRDAKINTNIDLIDTIFKDEASFLNLKNKDGNKLEATNIVNRETARIIKHSFEKQDNIIEANKYYALEMKMRSKELNFFKNPLDWFVFKMHGISSNHSQNWFLPIIWIFVISFFETVDINIDRLFFYYYNFNTLINLIANKINPFSIMTIQSLTFREMIYKIIIAYLIYQLIISIRQNTRRK